MDYPNIIELLQQLETEHEEDRYLYRGQMRRYPAHQWTVQQELREVEALYPADYRFQYQNKDFSRENIERIVQRVSAARAFGRMVRDQFSIFLAATLIAEGEASAWASALGFFPELVATAKDRHLLQNSLFFRMAWSLAQHYVIATALTDLTFSPRIAAWFATEPWDPEGEYPANWERGVIYRIHRSKLESILGLCTELSREMSKAEGTPLTPELFLIDIRDVPSSFARRPAAQQGASLYGFDQAFVIAAAFKCKAIEVFEFEHCPNCDIGVRRQDVVPTDDPFLSKLECFEASREAYSPKLVNSDPRPNDAPSLLDRANTAFVMGLVSAREVESIRLSDRTLATVFDQIKRRGEVEFRYLMLVEDEALKAVLCAITSEPIKPLPGLSPTALSSIGLGQVLRLWVPGNSMPIKYGNWETIMEFIESSSVVARKATSV
jgi:hypothetical protein